MSNTAKALELYDSESSVHLSSLYGLVLVKAYMKAEVLDLQAKTFASQAISPTLTFFYDDCHNGLLEIITMATQKTSKSNNCTLGEGHKQKSTGFCRHKKKLQFSTIIMMDFIFE